MDHPVQKGIRPNEIMQALMMMEENFLDSVRKKKGNPEKEHLRVLGEYPYRLDPDYHFLPYDETDNAHLKR